FAAASAVFSRRRPPTRAPLPILRRDGLTEI
uniref:Uncharacterized protein n=1 Tax=Triticum urartu TaxID=4572 RepID=A0A8R7PGN5_TRIUA